MHSTLRSVGCRCAFNAEFQIKRATRRDDLFPNWAQDEHEFDVGEHAEYDEQHFDWLSVMRLMYDRERVDALNAAEPAVQQALYDESNLLSDNEAEN